MTWAKLDDRFHDNRKIRRAWRQCPAAVGLHVMGLTYSAGHLLDGFVDIEFVEDRMPVARQREKATSALVEAGLWHPKTSGEPPKTFGWQINDFADFNLTRAEFDARRLQKSQAGKKGATTRWGDGKGMAGAIADDGTCYDTGMADDAPDPTRPLLVEANASTRSSSEKERERATEADRQSCRLFAQLVRKRSPKAKIPKAGEEARWLRDMRLLREQDNNTSEDIDKAIQWVFTDPSDDAQFWGTTIHAPSGLRTHFSAIWAKMTKPTLRAVPDVEGTESFLARRGAS